MAQGVENSLWGKPAESVQRFSFDLNIPQPSDPHKETVVHSAYLKLYKQLTWPQKLDKLDKEIRVNVYQLLESVSNQNVKVPRRLLDSKLVSLSTPGWESFDVRTAVSDWLNNPDSNFGLEISCDIYPLRDMIKFTSRSAVLQSSEVEQSDLEDLLPSLSVYTQDRLILGRQKRAEERHDCAQGDGEKRCCRYPLWVSFREIGWADWILAPEGYQAYYCDGSCPHRYKMAHRFAGIQSIIHMINPAAAPAPCCSANKLSPLNILHFDENTGQLEVSIYEDMVVEECKCS